jgi:hypothetical protein
MYDTEDDMAKQKPTGGSKIKAPQKAPDTVRGAVPYRPKMSKAEIRSAVETQLGKRVKLADFRAGSTPLPADESNSGKSPTPPI